MLLGPLFLPLLLCVRVCLFCYVFLRVVIILIISCLGFLPLDYKVNNGPIGTQKNQNGNKEKDFVGESAGSHLHEDAPGLACQGIGVGGRVRGSQQGLALRRQSGHHPACGGRKNGEGGGRIDGESTAHVKKEKKNTASIWGPQAE
jgi:hypothetical protein